MNTDEDEREDVWVICVHLCSSVAKVFSYSISRDTIHRMALGTALSGGTFRFCRAGSPTRSRYRRRTPTESDGTRRREASGDRYRPPRPHGGTCGRPRKWL